LIVFIEEVRQTDNEGVFEEHDAFDENLDEITEEEVTKAIKKLKSNKAGGPDCIVAELLTLAENDIVHFLTKLFNWIFEAGVFSFGVIQVCHCSVAQKGTSKIS
jgi:hypothetical protein